MSDDDLSDSESKAIGHAIREELARKRLTRQHLADKAKISLSTIEKALSGQRPFTLASVVRLEEALQLPLAQSPRRSARQWQRPCARQPGLLFAARRELAGR